MSEQWVIGRFVGERWYWLVLGDVADFIGEVDSAETFISFEEAFSVHGDTDGECILTLEAAQAIAERWAK